MTRRELRPLQADALTHAVEWLDSPWTRAGLAEAFGGVVEPARADELAQRVLALMPTEPVDRQTSLRALLVELPVLTEVIVPLEPEPAGYRFGVVELPDHRAVATLLNVTLPELEWFADRGGWLRRASDPLVHYRHKRLATARGVRLIGAPKPRLREMQRTILRRVLAPIPVHDACHGFEKGRSAATFAASHVGADVVVRIDLRNFFSSIGVARIRAIFAACGYSASVADVLAHLCTTATPVTTLRGIDVHHASLLRVPHLPQGAPTSPRLANLVARNLDRRLAGYARANGLTYTRYADDLALSGPAATDVDVLLWVVKSIVEAEGFTVNNRKTVVRRRHQRQTLAGLVVNSAPAVPRDTYDALRALLHNCARTGGATQNHADHPNFRAHVYGRIAWVGETHPGRRDRLLAMAARVDWDR